MLAYHDTARARSEGHTAPTIGQEIRYSLINATVISLAASLPSELITALLAHRIWQPVRALTRIRKNPDPAVRCDAFISVLPYLLEHQRSAVLTEALQAAEAITYDRYRAEALIQLAPHLPGELLRPALEAARAINDAWDWARTIGELASHLPDPQRSDELAHALEAAQAIRDDLGLDFQSVLRGLAPYLPADLLPRALEAARTTRDGPSRAYALTELAIHLPEAHRAIWLGEALDAALAFQDEVDLNNILGKLAPYLPAELLGQALEASLAMDWDLTRAGALRVLAPYLPAGSLGPALEAARAIQGNGARARALTVLSLRLPEAQRAGVLAEALEAARAIDVETRELAVDDMEARAWLLIELVPHLPEAQRPGALAEALESARAIIGKKDWDVHYSGGPGDWADRVEEDRACALGAVGMLMPEAQRISVLAEALDSVPGYPRQ